MTAQILTSDQLPIEDYHGSNFTSSSKLPDIRPCPALYRDKHITKVIPRVHKQVWDFGNAAHWRILEGEEAYNSRCLVRPDTYKNDKGEVKPWTMASNTCKDWIRGAAGKVVLSTEEVARIPRMMLSIGANPDALALLTGGESETTFRLKFSKYGIQARHDKWHPNGIFLPSENRQTGPCIVDLKTCESLERFDRDYYDLEYFYRAAFYQLVTAEVLALMAGRALEEYELPEFLFVAVEKTGIEDGGPLRCEVKRPDPEDLAIGAKMVHRDLAMLRQCHESGEWPSSRMGLQPLKLKLWQIRELGFTP